MASALALLVTVTPANAIDVPVQNQKIRLYVALEHANMLQDGHIVEGNPGGTCGFSNYKGQRGIGGDLV